MNKRLFRALETGNFTTIQRLHGENSYVLLGVTFQGDTPLHIAAREGHQHIVEWILQVQPSMAEALNKGHNTPLHEAAKCPNPDLVRLLLQHNDSISDHYNKFGETALVIASKYGHVATVKLLLKVISNNDSIAWDRSLGEAARRGYTDVVKAILDIPITFPTPILHAAVHGGHVEIVEAMLNSRAWNDYLMTTEDDSGRCAIHVAAMKGRWDIINKFLSRWPDCVQIRSSDHKSVLHFAVEYNQFEIVGNLLLNTWPQKVPELVSRDHDLAHDTALHLAAKNGVDPQLVEYLVSFPGVDVNALNDQDMTALDIASAAAPHKPNCAILVQILEGAGAIRSSLIRKSNTTSDLSTNLKQGGDTDIVNTHMVVASLIATVTFVAIFQIPGRIEDTDKNRIHYGGAKMALRTIFRVFLFSDTLAFSTSLTVVAAWLIRPQFAGSYLRGTEKLAYMSGVSLPVSIFWTFVAFVSAAIIVILPPNVEELFTKNDKAFSKYNILFLTEIVLAFYPPLFALFAIVRTRMKFNYSPTTFLLSVCLLLCVLALLIIYNILSTLY